MNTRTTYQPFCEVNLYHGYYLHPVEALDNTLNPDKQLEIIKGQDLHNNYNILKDLEFCITEEGKRLMKRHQMIFRPKPCGFTLWIRARETVEGQFHPFIPLKADFKLSFFLRLKNPTFLNFTGLNLQSLHKQNYYFSNLASNHLQITGEPLLYLNQAGEFYASENDQVSLISPFHGEEVSDLGIKEVRIELSSPLTSFQQVFRSGQGQENLSVCPLDLGKLPSGKYSLVAIINIDDSEEEAYRKEVYLDKRELPSTTVGIIELFHLTNLSNGPYAFLNSEGELLKPAYSLWWKNQKTQWRYFFNQPQEKADEDCDVFLENGQSSGKTFITKKILPLTHRYRTVCYQLDNPNTEQVNEAILLPNPEPDRIYPDTASTTIFSEVHMGDIDLGKVL